MSDAADFPALDAAGDQPKRLQIMDGARRTFLAHGYDGASMGDIAKAAGVSKGTLYVYFENKEALFEALILEERHQLAEALFQLDADEPDVKSVLRGLGLTFLEIAGRPEYIASVRTVIGASDKFPRFGQVFFEAGPCQGILRLQAYLDAQVAAGRLVIDDTRLAAQQFLDLCQAWLLKRLLFAVGGPPTAAERRYYVDSAIRMFLASYGPKPAAP